MVTWRLQHQFLAKTKQKIEKTHIGSEKSIKFNSLEGKKWDPDYLLDNFFLPIFKYIFRVMIIFNMDYFFSDFCYIAKYENSDRIKLLVENVGAIR